MYSNIFHDRRTNLIHIWDDEKGYYNFKYEPYCYVNVEKETKLKSIYGHNVIQKSLYEVHNDDVVFESDINIELKLLVDLYYESDTPPKNPKIFFIDIETDSKTGFPNLEICDKAILSVSIREYKKHTYVFLINDKNRFSLKNNEQTTFYTFDNEKEMLKYVVAFIHKEIPSVISGWNSERFDIPYLIGRGKKLFGNLINKLSPIGIIIDYFSKDSKKLRIAGVSHLDLMSLYKNYAQGNRESYSLNNIAKVELGEEKLKYDGQLWEFYEKDLNKFIEYNIDDTILLEKLEDKLNYIEIAINACHLGHIPYEQIYMTSRIMEGAILVYMRKHDLIAPNKPLQSDRGNEKKFLGKIKNWKEVKEFIDINEVEKDKEYVIDITKLSEDIILSIENEDENKNYQFTKEDFQNLLDDNSIKLSSIGRLYSLPNIATGAYVKEPLIGKYNWIIDLDYTSLYPSIIRTLNISPETKIGKVIDWIKHIDNYLIYKKTKEHKDTEIVLEKNDKVYNLTFEKLETIINKFNYSISTNGVLYSNTKGFISVILDQWFFDRVRLKNEYKKYLKIASEYEKTDKQHIDAMFTAKQFNIKQNVMKMMLNSMYGALLLPSFRFYDKDNGEAVTTTGQKLIKHAEFLINKFLNERNKTKNLDFVCTIDTDSALINVDSFVTNILDIRKIAKEIQTYVNTSLDIFSTEIFNRKEHYLSMKQELIANGAIFIGKKKYILNVIEKEGIPIKELDVKGIDIVRSNFSKYFKEELKNIVLMMLDNKTNDDINKKINEIKKGMDKTDILDISLPTGVKHVDKYYDENSRYKKGTPVYSKSAINYNILIEELGLTDKYQFIVDGDKIKYVFLKENEYEFETMAFKDEPPKQILDFIKNYIDYDRIYLGVLDKKIDKFYEALKWEKEYTDDNPDRRSKKKRKNTSN